MSYAPGVANPQSPARYWSAAHWELDCASGGRACKAPFAQAVGVCKKPSPLLPCHHLCCCRSIEPQRLGTTAILYLSTIQIMAKDYVIVRLYNSRWVTPQVDQNQMQSKVVVKIWFLQPSTRVPSLSSVDKRGSSLLWWRNEVGVARI